ncbi:neurogenic locus Notch protein-like [Microplitis mediator]|uniref:neurogenic locus Notch protein-like n=1 Tax=Microplitis mediator TaxID=375433 RepID=UPI002553B199|nr:neurogenic locus Notch protein-like [Microplitis mediator]
MCFKSLDCAADNAICDESKTCQCPVDFYLSVNKEECYSYAKKQTDFCETDIACRNLKYTYCSEDYKCACLQNYITVDGHCRGLINATCSEDSDCAVNNSICDESNTCQCPVSSYLSSNKDNCNLYAEKIYDYCDNDNSCRDLQFTYCSADKKCTCVSNYKEIAGHCRALINASCSQESECAANNSACELNICQCSIDFYPSSNKDKCLPYAKQLSDFCEANIGCRDVKYTYCSDDNRCVCSPNYTAVEGYCHGFIGSHCSESSDCASNNSICLSNICQCSVDSYLSTNDSKCHLLAKRIYDSCETDTGCRDLKYTYCLEDNRCTCLENYTIVNGYCLGLIDAKCSSDFDCAIDNSICDDSNTCQCPVDSYLSVGKNKCHPYVKHLHDFCENDMSCRGLKFTYCFEGKCTCLINYISNNGSCLGLIGSACSDDLECAAENSVCDQKNTCQCSVDFYPSLNKEKCHQYAKKLDDVCETDIGCRNLSFTNCSKDYKCSCFENYTVVNGYCRGLIDAKCSDDLDCAVENSICDESNTCQCSVDSYLSVEKNKCHPYAKHLHDFCENDMSCRGLKFTYCFEGKCTCLINYISNNGSCLGLIGSACSDDLECAAENSVCDQTNTCQCSVDFYPSLNKEKCHQYAKKLDDVCETDIGCRNLSFTNCSKDYKCSCIENYTVVNGYCRGLIDAKCSDDLDCAVENSICDESNTCQCSVDNYLSVDKRKCYAFAKQLNDFCESKNGCRDLKYTYCSEGNSCICSENYIEVDGYCRGLIGTNCSGNSDCAIERSICQSSTCQCPNDFYLSESGNQCYQYAKELNNFCETDISCREFKYTHCSDDNRCACLENYTVVDGNCRGLINANCSDDLDCAIENSICKFDTCQCSSNFYLSINKKKCYPYAKQLNDFCENDIGCTDLKHAVCSNSNQCTCSSNYAVIEGHCLGLIGANCSNDLDCGVDESICESNICQCRYGFYLSENQEKCYAQAKQLNEFCENDVGCSDLKYTVCSEENECVCLRNYTNMKGQCRADIGLNCSEDLDCAVDKSICKSNLCQCPNDYYVSTTKGKCFQYAKQLNEFCEDNVGCQDLKYSYCSQDNECICSANYREVSGYCRGLIGANCSDDLDCEAEYSSCDDFNTCQCEVDFYLSTNKDKCYSFASQVNDFCETDIGCQKRDHTRCWENACTCWPNYTIVDGNCRGLINAKCFVDSDCSIESSICASNTCQCPINFYLSADEKQCHSFAKHINDFCETDVGCRDLKFSYCSKDNKCTCLLGFIDDDGYCSGLIGSMCFKSLDCAADNAICDESKTCQCPVDFYLSVNKEECYPYAKKQTDFCETDIACRNLKYTYCSEDYKCACLQNYITVDGHCRSSINATCFEESDCAVNNSICDESNTCQCPVNSYLSSNNDNCNRYAQKMDDSCENNNSCRDLKFSYCSDNKKCTCLPNYKKLHGHCLGVIDANCFNDSDCAIENSICDTNICKCRIDSYLSASKNKCQSYANRVNDFCEANNSCRNLNNTYCSKDHKCVCLKNYTLIENYCRGFIGSNCSQDLDCASENSVCSKSTCQCHDNFYLSANETNCYAYAERIENFCEDDVGCRNLKYTYCSKNNKCTCLPNYVQVNDRCRGLINAKCLKDVDCAVNNSICDESNSCQCLNGFYLSANKGKCHQYAKQLDDFCETDDGCRNLKYAHCSKKNKCICLLNYTEAGGYCRGFIGSNCSENLDCLVDYLVCKSNVCQCPDNFYFSSSQQQCIPYAKQLKDFCETDKSCRDIKFTHCSENKQCTCLPNYVEKDGNCRGLIDEFCFEDSDCKVENSRCNSNVCQCSFDYYPSVNNDNCFKYAQNLTDYCEDNEGCRKIKYSFCSDDKNCTCFTPYKENGGQCLGVFNASCFNETDCDSFYECSSNRCSCRDNFVFDDYHKCIPVNRYLGDSCIDNEYCRSIEHSSCDSDYHCTCSTNYINVNGSCLHYLGTCCFKDSDCGIKDSICQGYTCKCKKKYFFHPFFIECRKK